VEALSARNFGLLIAYVIPGFVILVGLSGPSEAARVWLVGAAMDGPNLGGFLYVTLASVALGMTASAVRWAVLDSIHTLTGLKRPQLDESKLEQYLSAFDYLVEKHFRYYQFYGNSVVALLSAYAAWRVGGGVSPLPYGVAEALLVFIVAVFTAGSRDALRNYFAGGEMLLGRIRKESEDDERQARTRGPKALGQQGDGEAVAEQTRHCEASGDAAGGETGQQVSGPDNSDR
jgi:hypothetical protein